MVFSVLDTVIFKIIKYLCPVLTIQFSKMLKNLSRIASFLSLKDHFAVAVLPKVDAEGRSKPCGGRGAGEEKRSYEVCKSINYTSYFKRRATDETFNILKGPLDYSSNRVIFWQL